jgi:hypothetical protein
MPEIILNSFATNTDKCEYLLPENARTYSTIASPSDSTRAIKMDFKLERASPTDRVFGNHLREAAGIVKDWTRRK